VPATRFTELVGCELPLQLAPMGTVGTPELVAAVANAGGHGMFAGVMVPPPALRQVIDQIGWLTGGPFGINFLVPLIDPECVEIAAHGAGLVEFFYGDPDPALVARVHGADGLASWQVGSEAEASRAVAAGCDVIVVQGIEAGGRLRGTAPLLPLLERVLRAVAGQVPVVAAGGIATAHGVRGVLDAGAAAARVGTRFIAAQESGAHPAYVEAVVRAGALDTVITDKFSVMWPPGPSPARVLRSCVAAAERLAEDYAGAIPAGDGMLPLPRFAAPAPGRQATGTIEAMAMYAGVSAGEVRRVEPARAIVSELTSPRSSSSAG